MTETEKKKEYRKDDRKPTEMFLDSMSEGGIGSDELTCDWCGRLHLCPDYLPYSYNDSGFDADADAAHHRAYCEEEHTKNPDGVVLHYDCDCITGRYLNDMLFVLECPCNGLSRYETFIWANKNTIRKYLKERIQQEYDWAEQELTKNKLAGIV